MTGDVMTTTFRERIEAMTAGPWILCGAHPWEVCDVPGLEANATGIVLSVATARLVASDEAVEMVARAIDPEAWVTRESYLRRAIRYGDADNETEAARFAAMAVEEIAPSLETARRVLSAIQAAAMEGV